MEKTRIYSLRKIINNNKDITMENHEVYKILKKILNEPRIARLYDTMKDKYQGLKISHNWEHIMRVVLNAVVIGTEEGADLPIVITAALLHDIGFITNPSEPKKHNEYGAMDCLPYLNEWTNEEKKMISNIILKHKGKYPGYTAYEPVSLEEKVLCDADQVDKFGWIGLMQVIKVYAEYGTIGYRNYDTMRGLAEGIEEASHIELYTGSARKMAEKLREPSYHEVSQAILKELSFFEGWKD
jgi:uncharacterized protein